MFPLNLTLRFKYCVAWWPRLKKNLKWYLLWTPQEQKLLWENKNRPQNKNINYGEKLMNICLLMLIRKSRVNGSWKYITYLQDNTQIPAQLWCLIHHHCATIQIYPCHQLKAFWPFYTIMDSQSLSKWNVDRSSCS